MLLIRTLLLIFVAECIGCHWNGSAQSSPKAAADRRRATLQFITTDLNGEALEYRVAKLTHIDGKSYLGNCRLRSCAGLAFGLYNYELAIGDERNQRSRIHGSAVVDQDHVLVVGTPNGYFYLDERGLEHQLSVDGGLSVRGRVVGLRGKHAWLRIVHPFTGDAMAAPVQPDGSFSVRVPPFGPYVVIVMSGKTSIAYDTWGDWNSRSHQNVIIKAQ